MVLSAVDHLDSLATLDSRRVEVSAKLDSKQRAKLGQFFTPIVTARLMASMFSMQDTVVRILDAGAGM